MFSVENPCSSNPCDENACCDDALGFVTCDCYTGYTGNGLTCTGDISLEAYFKYIIFFLQHRPYTGQVKKQVVFVTDIDECSTTVCTHTHLRCVNAQGSYACCCEQGYIWDGSDCVGRFGIKPVFCVIRFESFIAGPGVVLYFLGETSCSSNPCDENACCDHALGVFSCDCNTGYTGNGVTCTGKIAEISCCRSSHLAMEPLLTRKCNCHFLICCRH